MSKKIEVVVGTIHSLSSPKEPGKSGENNGTYHHTQIKPIPGPFKPFEDGPSWKRLMMESFSPEFVEEFERISRRGDKEDSYPENESPKIIDQMEKVKKELNDL